MVNWDPIKQKKTKDHIVKDTQIEFIEGLITRKINS
jgi:hypothetical protein